MTLFREPRCTACQEGQGRACTCRQPVSDPEAADVIVGLLWGGVAVICVVVVALWWGLS